MKGPPKHLDLDRPGAGESIPLNRPTRRSAFPRMAILACFFLSGVAGLMYEVLWSRMLVVIFGHTMQAVAIVLAAYMTGLALGSLWGGRRVDRRARPWRTYGLLEIGIGLYGLGTILLFPALPHLFAWLAPSNPVLASLLRFGGSFLLLLVPTSMMGATLPILCRSFVNAGRESGRRSAGVYAINTLGGVLGCFGVGFYLIENVGISASLTLAGGINLACGLIALLLAWRRRETIPDPAEPEVPERPSGSPLSPRLVRAVFFVSGATALVYQVVWTRVLALAIGSTVYAFTTITGIFILALAVGTALAGRFQTTQARAAAWLAWLQIGVGLVGAASFAGFPWYAPILGELAGFHTFAPVTQASVLGMCLLAGAPLLPIGILSGGIFPAAIRTSFRSIGTFGREVGGLYARNAFGAAAGALAAVFLLIPRFGYGTTLLGVALVNVLLGGWVFWKRRRPVSNSVSRFLPGVAVALGTGLCVVLLARWDSSATGSRTYMGKEFKLRDDGDYGELLFYKEGVLCTVEVYDHPAALSRVLRLNGRTHTNTGFVNSLFEWRKAHLPLLLIEDPKSVLHIGLGAGLTLSAEARHPVDRLEVVEISPGVVEAARRMMESESRDVFKDARVRLYIDDGRNHVLSAPRGRTYDLILGDVNFADEAGIGNLFAKEHFAQCRARLAPGGIMCQWFVPFTMDEDQVKVLVRTFRSVFPHATMWRGCLDPIRPIFALVGSPRPLRLDPERLDRRIPESPCADELHEVGLGTTAELLSWLVLNERQLERYAGSGPLNTDDRPLIEFLAPKRSGSQALFPLGSVGADSLEGLVAGDDASLLDAVRQARRYQRAMVKAHLDRTGGNDDAAAQGYKEALRIRPGDRVAQILMQIAQGMTPADLLKRGKVYARSGQPEKAVRMFSTLVRLNPRSAEGYNNLGVVHYTQKNWAEAERCFERAVRLAPEELPVRFNLGRTYAQLGKIEEARSALREILRRDPEHARAKEALGQLP